MSERLTVILPPVLTDEEKLEKALYAGSFTIGDGWGDGYLHCRGDGYGDGAGLLHLWIESDGARALQGAAA
jgi:hypothetical protein